MKGWAENQSISQGYRHWALCIESASGEREGVDFSPLRKSPGPTTRGVEGKECRRGEGSLSRDQDMPEKGNRAIKVAPVPLLFPRWHSGKESACQCRRCKRCRFNPYTEEDPTGGGNGSPLQYSCLENPMDSVAWWATVHGSQRVRHRWAHTHNASYLGLKLAI